jgi:serine/threonine protein kinase
MGTAIPQRLGDFEIVREIGRGGMGVVYEARQVSLNRKVALKVLSGWLGLTPKAVQRFRREAEAAAKLHHTNIVPVYATGEQDGTHFYAMELIEGPSLDHVIRQMRAAASTTGPGSPGSRDGGALSPDLGQTGPYVEGANIAGATSGLNSSSLGSGGGYFDTVARMVAEVADALEYARHQSVIHRDIKPSNLLLSPAGRLSINDFGLARMLEQPGMTMTGEFVGTPAYMSPEQITAGRAPLNHRTDIYSLGATLYELLTLQRPFPGERREEVIAQIMHKEPKSPRRINRKVPLDLETICLKAMEKDPDRRYQTAGTLAEDLRRYVNRFAISARRAGLVQRLVKWFKRHPGLAAGVGLALMAILLASLFAVQSWRERQDRLASEEVARQKLLAEKKQRAVFLIFNGQFPEAEAAIAEAEALGVEEEWAQWRRGLIAFHRGEGKKAYELLKLAVAKMPDNVAAACQLKACDPSSEAHSSLVERISSLTPTTPEDYLYKGLVEAYPDNGLRALSEGLERQPSLIAYVLRAQVRADYALDSTDLAAMEGAKDDAIHAKSYLRGNPHALATSVYVYVTAAELYAQIGKEQAKLDEALKSAWKDAAEWERCADVPDVALSRGSILQLSGRDEEALDVWEKAVAKSENAAKYYALGLYGRGKPGDVERAIDILNRHVPEMSDREWLLTVFTAELDGRKQSLENLKKRIKLLPPNDIWLLGLYDQYPLLFLLGERDLAIEAVHKYSPDLERHPFGIALEFHRSCLDYLRDPGPATEDKMLQSSGGSQIKVCWAHWLIGCVRLGNGEREAALGHFEACVATHAGLLVPHGCRAYVARMKKDPNWPPWIPPKKQERKP